MRMPHFISNNCRFKRNTVMWKTYVARFCTHSMAGSALNTTLRIFYVNGKRTSQRHFIYENFNIVIGGAYG